MNRPRTPLPEQLKQAADTLDPEVPDLRGSAHRVDVRRRAAVFGLAVVTIAAVSVGAVGVHGLRPRDVTQVQGTPLASASIPSVGASTSTPMPTRSDAPSPLDHATIVERCRPQLKKLASLPMYADARGPLRVAHPHDYRVGNLVLIVGERGASAGICRIPAEGKEDAPVPLTSLGPHADDPANVAEYCSEMLHEVERKREKDGSPGFTPRYNTADLRGAKVISVTGTDGPVQAILRAKGTLWRCLVQPVAFDLGMNDVGLFPDAPVERYRVLISGTASLKSITGPGRAYYYAAGTLPPDAASIEFSGGAAGRVQVLDGRYNALLLGDGSKGLQPVEYVVKDAQGKVLHRGVDMRAGQPGT